MGLDLKTESENYSFGLSLEVFKLHLFLFGRVRAKKVQKVARICYYRSSSWEITQLNHWEKLEIRTGSRWRTRKETHSK